MKPFRFRAARLLDLRRRTCDAARAELARLRDAARRVEAELDRARRACRDADAAYHQCMQEATDVDRLQRHRNWIHRLNASAAALEREVAEHRLAVARGAEHVHQELRRVRVLERLRERALRRYENEARRHEAREIDRHAVLRHARRTIEGGITRDR